MYGRSGHHSAEIRPAFDSPCAIMECKVSCSDIVMLFRTIVLFDFSSNDLPLKGIFFPRISYLLIHVLFALEMTAFSPESNWDVFFSVGQEFLCWSAAR